jgi:DtxR family Mn-dependent transcriptional regulator
LRPEFDIADVEMGAVQPLSLIASTELVGVTVRRFGETIQVDTDTMTRLRRVGALPGAFVQVRRSPGGISIGSAGEYTELADELAMYVLVDAVAFGG